MNLPDPLSDARLRLGRARKHLDAIRDEIAAYLDDRPYVPVIDSEAEVQQMAESGQMDAWLRAEAGAKVKHTIKIVASEVRPLPPDVTLTVSDLVHSLRAALDSIAWRLVEHASRGGEDPVGWQNQHAPDGTRRELTWFPIHDGVNRDAWGHPTPKLLQPFTTHEIEAALDGLQPYQAGDAAQDHPLAYIRNLNDTDKHQTLAPLAQVVSGGRFLCRFDSGWLVGHDVGSLGTWTGEVTQHHGLEDGAIVGFVSPTDFLRGYRERPGHVRVERAGGVLVSLDEPGTDANPARDLAAHMSDLIAFVQHEVLERFEPVFDGEDPRPVLFDDVGRPRISMWPLQ